MLLEVDKLNTFYGNLHAIWDISIEVGEGEIVALIGSNGAGKSTLLKTLAGSVPMRSGEIRYQGRTLAPSQMKANHLVREGIILCPEGRHIFPRMPVEENLRIGGYTRPKEELKQSYERVYELFPRPKDRRQQIAGTLSGGEQQMLAIGRSLMGNPKLLMLDEPSLGLSPLLTEKIFELIQQIRDQGTTVLLVEQNAVAALAIANKAYVLKVGHIRNSGTGRELLQSEEIVKSYLGA